jgi:hypothetical protein
MKTQFGKLAGGDFEENTMTIKIHNDMILRAGNYAIVPIDEYNKLVSQDKQHEPPIDLLQFDINVDQYLQELKEAKQ